VDELDVVVQHRWRAGSATYARLAGRQGRLDNLAATILDADGNRLPEPRHHPSTERTCPLRFARTG